MAIGSSNSHQRDGNVDSATMVARLQGRQGIRFVKDRDSTRSCTAIKVPLGDAQGINLLGQLAKLLGQDLLTGSKYMTLLVAPGLVAPRKVATASVTRPAAAPAAKVKNSLTDPIRVDWLKSVKLPHSGRIGMTFAPGKKGYAGEGFYWDRDLALDLTRLREQFQIEAIVCLMEEHELAEYKLPNLLDEAAHRGMLTKHYPVIDVSAPASIARCAEVVDWVLGLANQGKNVVVHCRGGLGRTGLLAACCLARIGHPAAEAMTITRHCRKGTIESHPQEQFVRKFAAWCARHPLQHVTATVSSQESDAQIADPLTLEDRYIGTLAGLAVGDALGTTLEFTTPGKFEPITDMVGGGPFGLKAGQWTDDTSMALCMAESLVEKEGFDPIDQLARYVRWWQQGHLSSTGKCFDIGNATAAALHRFMKTHEPYCGSTSPQAAGNGSLMRLAPVPMFFANDPAAAIERSGDSSRTTHAATTCVDACRYYSGLIVGALKGVPKDVLLSARYCPASSYLDKHPLCPEIDAVAAGSFKKKNPPAIRGSGYVVNALEAALWAFHHSTSFRGGCLMAVNLGDDADTTGAIYGQLAGAYYGYSAIPEGWRAKLAMRETIEALAIKLLCLRTIASG